MASAAGSTKCSAASRFPTRCRRRSHETRPHHRQARAERVLHLAGRVRLPGDLPSADRILHLHRGQFLRARRSEPRRVLRLASVAVPRGRAGDRHAPVGRGAALRNAGAPFHHADHHLAGDRRQVPRLLALHRRRAAPHLPRGHHGERARPMKKFDHILYSVVGLAALLLILVAVNFFIGKAPVRFDLSEGKLYTLSPGTKKILGNLSAPVKVKLYISQGESVPVPLRGFAQRVEDTVREFKSAAGQNLIVERYNPRPDSEEEDAAQLDGIEPQQLVSGESFYLGAVVSQLDRKQSLAAITPQRERLLEYDLVRAISRVANPQRPTIGLMAGLPVRGEKFNPFTRQSSEPWALASELKREVDVTGVSIGAHEVDQDINVLLLIHPQSPPPQTEYALDQFVMLC